MRLFGTKRIRALYIAAHTMAAPAPAMAQQKTATGKLGLRPVNNAPADRATRPPAAAVAMPKRSSTTPAVRSNTSRAI